MPSTTGSTALRFWYHGPRKESKESQTSPQRFDTIADLGQYEVFFRAYYHSIPNFNRLEEAFRWRHRQREHYSYYETMNYLRAIWICLIRLVYGQECLVQYPGKVSSMKRVFFILNVYAYAELLCLDDEILRCIKQSLEEDTGIWKLIAESPTYFIDLAYRLELPDMYLDAVKHLTSPDAGLGPPKSFVPTLAGLRDREVPEADSEKLLLLMAARLKYEDEKATIVEELMEFTCNGIYDLKTSYTEIQTPGCRIFGCSMPKCTLVTLHDYESKADQFRPYLIAVRGLFMDNLAPKLSSLGSRRCFDFLSLRGVSVAEILRVLIGLAADSLEDRIRKEAIRVLQLKALAKQHALKLNTLTHLVLMVLHRYKNILQRTNAFSPRIEHECSPAGTRGWYICAACARPKHQLPWQIFVVDPASTCDSFAVVPWPLSINDGNEGVWEDSEQEEAGQLQEEQVAEATMSVPGAEKTQPATFAHLKAIGLSEQFSHLEFQAGPDYIAVETTESAVLGGDPYDLDLVFELPLPLPDWSG